ncbi:MAG: CoA transferase [Deltaproteobacteria bacterium]|nr:CoA transferase [Deltaproteobacteria bacterium]
MKPLERYKILDVTQRLPGPLCTMILSDMGMDVIKIEEPSKGDFCRSMPPLYNNQGALFVFLNRNKRSVTLDLKSAEGREIFLKMTSTADAVLEGFKPGFMGSLKLGYEDLRQVNPAIVYCSLSGYGQDGPYRDRAGHDLNYNALSGILAMTGNEDGPVPPGALLADVAGGLGGVISIMMGLLHRGETGQGQYIDVSMFDILLSWFCLANVAESVGANRSLSRGETSFTGKLACYQVYKTADGRYVSLGALEPKFWAQFCDSIERDDLKLDYLNDERQAYLKEELRKIFVLKDRDEWVSHFAGKDFCFEPVKTAQESLSDIHVLARKLIFEADGCLGERIKQLNLPLKSSALKDPTYYARPPLLGEHTDDILLQLGFDILAIEEFRRKGTI